MIILAELLECDIKKKEKDMLRLKREIKKYHNKVLTKKNMSILRTLNDMLMVKKDEISILEKKLDYQKNNCGIQESWEN